MERLITEGLRTICGGSFSFSARRGECVALSGPSGCGKTLLLRAIADLDPAEGNIRLDGEDRNAIPAPLWRRRVGWLPAESSWWFDRVGDHLIDQRPEAGGQRIPSIGKKQQAPTQRVPSIGRSEREGEIASALGRLGFEKDVFEWRVERLSTGEKQRLSLFRLWLNEPQVLLLDEPTAALDPMNVGLVEDLITTYRRDSGAVVLWVSHDSEQIARTADRHLRFSGTGLEEVQ